MSTRAEVDALLTLPKLIAWLETRDPEERYYYTSNDDCLVARYLRSMGVEHFGVSPRHVRITPATTNNGGFVTDGEQVQFSDAIENVSIARTDTLYTGFNMAHALRRAQDPS